MVGKARRPGGFFHSPSLLQTLQRQSCRYHKGSPDLRFTSLLSDWQTKCTALPFSPAVPLGPAVCIALLTPAIPDGTTLPSGGGPC